MANKPVVCRKEKPNYATIIMLSIVGSLVASIIVLVIDRATSADLRAEVTSLKYQVASLKSNGASYQ
jgi:hypothetical protein